MKLILVRHGETSWNKEAKLLSKTDIELNKVGINQAKLVSKKLKDKKFNLIFSSSKKRALKTAEIINENYNG